MLLQALFTLGIMLTTIQTVIDIRDRESRYNRESAMRFDVRPEDLSSTQCQIEPKEVRALHYLHDTCPTSYDPLCHDSIFNKYHEFEFRCRFPIMANSVLSMNSTSFLDLIKMRDPYGRDWCMIVLFYAQSCSFSAKLAPHFNKLAGRYENLLPVAVDASDFTKSYRLNFRYGISGTPTVLLWVNGMGVARMGNKALDLESIQTLLREHTDLVELKDKEELQENVPEKLISLGGELKNVEVDPHEDLLIEAIYTIGCLLACVITFIYHIRERILLSAPVLQWFQSKCGGPLSDDIYFLFYVTPPRHHRGAPPPPPPPAQEAPEAAEDVIELPPLVVEEHEEN